MKPHLAGTRKSPGCRSTPGLFVKGLRSPCRPCHGRVAHGAAAFSACRRRPPRWSGTAPDGRRVLQRRSVTLTGSATPALSRSSYSPVAALRPWPAGRFVTFSATTPGSRPPLKAICLSGRQRNAHDVGAGRLVTRELQLVQRRCRLQQSHATTGDDALLDGCLRVRTASSMRCLRSLSSTSVAAPALITQHRCQLARRSAASRVVVGVAVLDLGTDLRDPARDGVGIPGTLDDRGLVLGDDDLAGLAKQRDVGGLQGQPDLFADDLATVRIAMSCSMALRRSPKPGALTATDLKVRGSC